jgi:hypothetical protein
MFACNGLSDSTMTNGAVAQQVQKVEANTLQVNYKDGEKPSTNVIVGDANGQALAYVYFEEEPGRRPVKLTKTVLAQSRVPYRAGSAASTAAPAATAATAASYPQAHAAPAATTTSATTMSCTAAAPAAAYVAAAYMAAAAATAMASAASAASAPSAASPCKPYAGAKFSFFVENVKGPQAHIKHFLLGEKNSLPRVLGPHVCCRRVCRCTAHHRQRHPGSRPHG